VPYTFPPEPWATAVPRRENLHAPYLAQSAILGEVPTTSVDVPITCVFLVLFILGAIANMGLFRRNKTKGHFFMPSFFLYVFCMARILSCSLRIAWAYQPKNASLSIAAFIFVSAGVLIIFVVNLIFAQRIVRAVQPRIGWSAAFSRMYKVMYALTVMLLIVTVIAIVHSHYTLDRHQLRTDLDIELGAISYFLFLAFLPILLIYIGHVLPRMRKPAHFGTGSWTGKVRVLTVGALLCTFGAGFRTGSQFMHPRRPDEPAWYHSKACFYLFNFGVEVSVVYLYLFTRVDRRFYVPNGCHADGEWAQKMSAESSTETLVEKRGILRQSSVSSYARMLDGSSSIYTWGHPHEREVKHPFEPEEPEAEAGSPRWSYLFDADSEESHNSAEHSWDSASTLQLPDPVTRSRFRVVETNEAPYLHLIFSQEDGEDQQSQLQPTQEPRVPVKSFVSGLRRAMTR
jgi:hypothetical protein